MEDLKLNSTESIPKQFIEKAEAANREIKRDKNYDYVKDANGNYVYEINSRGVKEAIKGFASHFADYGVDINQIDFDDYLVEGVTLDKIPRGALTVIQIRDSSVYNPNSKFYVFDKRKSSNRENPLWEANSRRMYHSRKGKTVDAGRIPDYQFLEAAENIWIIPEEVLTRDVGKVRSERRQSKVGIVERAKSLPTRWWGDETRRIDKSGYIIDQKDIDEKLKKFKDEKRLKSAGSHLAIAESEIKNIVDKYNTMVTEILSAASRQISSGKLTLDLSAISQVNGRLNDTIDDLLRYAGSLDKGESYSRYGFDREMRVLKGLESTDSWSRLEREYKRALEVKQVDGAVEGRGCKYNRTLQATEGYFTDREIIEAFEEV